MPAPSRNNGTERPLQNRDMRVGVAFVEAARIMDGQVSALYCPKMANERSGGSRPMPQAKAGCGAFYCFDLRAKARVPALARATSSRNFHNTRGNRP